MGEKLRQGSVLNEKEEIRRAKRDYKVLILQSQKI